MEEKERYKLESHNGTFCEFHDTETDEWYTRKDLVTDLLNQQDKRIKELEEENNFLEKRNEELKEQLANSIRPKFNRQEHIYCVAFGEIREFVVVAYLDNNITLCEDTTTSRLEWCDNNFLVLTKAEAEAKLKELKGENK